MKTGGGLWESGQAVTEYVIVLAMMVLLVVALLALFGGVAQNGRRMVDLVSFELP